MVKVAISEFRAHMAKYLAYVMNGQRVVLTSHGKDVAEMKQPVGAAEGAQGQLTAIAKRAKIHDVEAPVLDQFEVNL